MKFLFCLVLSSFVKLCSSVLVFVEFCQILSKFVRFCQILSNSVTLCQFYCYKFSPNIVKFWSNIVIFYLCRISSAVLSNFVKLNLQKILSNLVEFCQILSNSDKFCLCQILSHFVEFYLRQVLLTVFKYVHIIVCVNFDQILSNLIFFKFY